MGGSMGGRSRRSAHAITGWRARLAGGLLLVVGATNAVMGLLGLISEQVLLGVGPSVALIVAGGLTAAAGVAVWRGSRITATVALTIFGLLLLVQLLDLAVTDHLATAIARLVILVLMVAALALATLQGRSGRGTRAVRSPGSPSLS